MYSDNQLLRFGYLSSKLASFGQKNRNIFELFHIDSIFKINKLILKDNKINSLESRPFHRLKLIELDIENNNISKISLESFLNLRLRLFISSYGKHRFHICNK